jgi:hypothetical protein
MVVGCSRPDYCHEKNVHLTLVSLIKVEGLFSPYIVTHFHIVNSSYIIVGSALHTIVPSFGRNKPIFLSHV